MNRRYSIVIIEDNPEDTELILLELNKSDFSFYYQCIDSKEEFKDIFEDHLPDLVISDYNLPGFNGMDALRLVREYDSDLPFILCSGYIGIEKAVKAVREGATDFVLKENLRRLNHSVTKALENYILKNKQKADEELINATFNNAGLNIAIINSSGEFTKVNKKFAELTGYSEQELTGSSYSLLQEDEKKVLTTEIFDQVRNEDGVISKNWKLLRKDGAIRYVNSTHSRLQYGNQHPYIVSYIQDLTETARLRSVQKQAEITEDLGGWELNLAFDKLYCNGGVKEVFDFPASKEIVMADLVSRLAVKSGKNFKKAVHEAEKLGRSFDIQLQIPGSQDSKKWIKATGVPEQVNGRTVHIYGTFKDITKNVLRTRELKEKQRLLDTMSELSKIGYWELDLKKKTVLMSPITRKIHEVGPDYEPTLERAITFYKEGEHRDRIKTVVNDAIKKGTSYDEEILFITAKGNERWVRAVGQPKFENGECVRLSGSFQDIDKRKRAQISSDRSRQLLQTITDQTEAAIWVRDEEGKHLFVNKKWKRIFGLENQVVIGRKLIELIDASTAEKFRKHDLKIFETNRSRKYEERVKTPTGNRYFLTNEFPINAIRGVNKAIGGVGTDITERKEMEDELKFNSILLDQVGDAVIATDPDGKIIYWNQAAEDLYGWKSKETIGENILEITPSLNTKEKAAEIWEKLSKGNDWNGEFEAQRKDGSSFPIEVTNSPVFDDQGALVAVIGVSNDISERKEAERKIQQTLEEKEVLLAQAEDSQEKFKQMFEYAPSAISLMEGPELRFTYANENYRQLIGDRELLGKKVKEVFPEFSNQGRIKLLENVYEEGKVAFGNQEPIEIIDPETQKSSKKYIDYVYQPLKTESGQVYSILVEITDVTDQVKYSKQLETSLQEKKTLLTEIHHRVKNNLAIVTSLLTLQNQEIEDDYLQLILQRCRNRIYSIAMVHELLYQSESFTEVPFKMYLQKLVKTVQNIMDCEDNNIAISFDISIDGMNINQAIPLGLLFNELLTNSYKYAFDGLTMGQIMISISKEDNQIIVLYEDNGKGYGPDSDFENPQSLGLTLIHTLLQQLDSEYTVDTKDKFRLEFYFSEQSKGSHSNLKGNNILS